MAIYETIDRKRAEAKEMKNKSASMEELETPTASVKSFKMNGEEKNKAEPQVNLSFSNSALHPSCRCLEEKRKGTGVRAAPRPVPPRGGEGLRARRSGRAWHSSSRRPSG